MPKIEFTGFAVEFTTDSKAIKLPLYRFIKDSKASFEDYVFSEKDIDFQVPYRTVFSTLLEHPKFVKCQDVLQTLYTDYKVARPLTAFLTELREHFPFDDRSYVKRKRHFALIPALEELGFDVMDMFSYGRTIMLELAWIFPPDRQDKEAPPHVSAGCVEFRPNPDKTLDAGKWVQPEHGYMPWLMQKELRKHHRGTPLTILSPEGRQQVINAFKWSPVSLMTNKEARQARIEFARKNRELLDKPRDLAVAMLKAGLYSDTATPSQIMRNLGSIIEEAKKGSDSQP